MKTIPYVYPVLVGVMNACELARRARCINSRSFYVRGSMPFAEWRALGARFQVSNALHDRASALLSSSNGGRCAWLLCHVLAKLEGGQGV